MIRINSYVHLLLWFLCSASVDGALRFANYYQDHMVLQRAPQRAIVWGYADTFNTPIRLTMNNKIYDTRSSSLSADASNGSIWAVSLDPQAEEGPFQVKVTQPLPNGTLETITLDDVLFGDVWVCSGQSNMGFSLRNMFNASIEIENAYKYPKIRLFTASTQQSYTPQEELLSIALPWSVASNITVANGANSAVCWLYGRMIHEGLGGRPIGLVHSSWGGTSIEWWSPPEALKECNITQTQEVSVDGNDSLDVEVGVTLNNTVIYNAMIHPLTRMVIRGVIWYQGNYMIKDVKKNMTV
jgi:sialate O-acetylesterase